MHKAREHNAARIKGFIIALTGSLLFSTKAIIVRHAFIHTHIDALSLLTVRMLYALPFYIGMAWLANGTAQRKKISTRQWAYIIILGAVGYYLSSLFDFLGLQYISAGLERLILFLYPTFAVLINALVFRQQVSRFQKWALLLTYLGIGIAYWGEFTISSGGAGFFKGSFFIFLCAVTFALYIVGSGRLIPYTGANIFTSYAMIAATAGILLHYAFSGNAAAIHFGKEMVGYGLLLGIIATVVPSYFMSNGIKYIGTNNAAIVSGIGPVSTILQAHFVLGEKIFPGQVIGTVLVIIGIVLIGWKNSEI